MFDQHEQEALDPQVEDVMRALYEVDDLIYGFRIPFDEISGYRRGLYRARAAAAIAAMDRHETKQAAC